MIAGKKHVGIGFATGRISFQNVLRAFIYHLQESHFCVEHEIALSLFVAYDPSYHNTSKQDYDNLSEEEKRIFHQCHFIGPEDTREEIARLVRAHVVPDDKAAFCFGSGYAVQRNRIVYEAVKNQVDYLIFLDDDEYPLAVTRSGETCLWSGQLVLEEHIKHLAFADYTNGYHCGYLSPLPSIEFDGILDERIFQQFTTALSSDVLQWDSVVKTMQSGGVTYADKSVLIEHKTNLVPWQRGARFISGGNLGINLTRPERLLPFYNPPGARGEDSILSTFLNDAVVKSIPVYTFHDGFGFYGSLLKGVLPIALKKVSHYDSATVIDRFYRACVGWIRYKPLYTYLTQPDAYKQILEEAKIGLEHTVESVCAYFNHRAFLGLLAELEQYTEQLPIHYDALRQTRAVWVDMIKSCRRD